MVRAERGRQGAVPNSGLDHGRTPEEILAWVSELLVANFEVDAASISMSSRLLDDLDLDSIDAVTIALEVEKQTGYELEAEELSVLGSVEDVVKLIGTVLARPPS